MVANLLDVSDTYSLLMVGLGLFLAAQTHF